MVSDNIEKIYSNNYADFLIVYNGNLSILDQFKDAFILFINLQYAVVFLPVEIMTENVISAMGYSKLPSLFGLVSESSAEASGIPRIRAVPNYDLRGKGVLIGIADTGIDYTNPIFQYADKTTRISSLWDQTILNSNPTEEIPYGTEYTREQINTALNSTDPYLLVPSKDEIGHGTMVAGIAAGNEVPESGFYGVAPDSELVIVKLKPAKPYLKKFFRFPEDAILYQENDFIFGIQYLLDYAAKVNMPIVICIAVDTNQYAHDGRGSTSRWLSLWARIPGIAILLPVGNEGLARRHYQGAINTNEEFNLVELNVAANESGFSMELWGASPNLYSIDITSPSGEYIPRMNIKLNETREISFIFEPTIIYVDYQMIESQSGDQLILLRFSNPAEGIWNFKVYGKGIYPMIFNIWLPMNDFVKPDTYFIRSNPYITLLSISCSIIPIGVTAYNHEDDSLYLKAGKGYTRINVIKPEIAAPGVNILSPSLNQDFIEVTGTSAAVAHASGIAAMMFEWGIVEKNFPLMSTTDMKIFMIRGARRNINLEYPNREWGYGILDIYNVFDSLRRL